MRVALVAIAVLCACARGSTGVQQDSSNGSGKGDGTGSGTDAAPMADSRPIDASNGCAMQPCTIDPQCGCTAANAPACDIGSGNANACRFATTTGVEGQTCTAPTECAAGYTCVGGGPYSCEKYCTATSQCISPRGQCVIQLTDGTNPIPGAVVCSSNCDPAAATNALCPTNWTCDLFTSTYNATDYNISDCRPNGTAAVNAACSTTVACAAGLTCVNNGTSTLCLKICNKTANTGCTGGKTCTGFSTAFTVGGTEYGVCN